MVRIRVDGIFARVFYKLKLVLQALRVFVVEPVDGIDKVGVTISEVMFFTDFGLWAVEFGSSGGWLGRGVFVGTWICCWMIQIIGRLSSFKV